VQTLPNRSIRPRRAIGSSCSAEAAARRGCSSGAGLTTEMPRRIRDRSAAVRESDAGLALRREACHVFRGAPHRRRPGDTPRPDAAGMADAIRAIAPFLLFRPTPLRRGRAYPGCPDPGFGVRPRRRGPSSCPCAWILPWSAVARRRDPSQVTEIRSVAARRVPFLTIQIKCLAVLTSDGRLLRGKAILLEPANPFFSLKKGDWR
jgi:hypothetical protein